jgi:hypothetical protein
MAQRPCRERQEIVESIRATVDQILSLHRLEMDAVQHDDIEGLESIEHDLDKATAFKSWLLIGFKSHLQAHGYK